MLDLQSLVDDLCDRLGRSVAVDDNHFKSAALSAQVGVIDRLREGEVLARRPEAATLAFMRSLGLAHARDTVQVPANAQLGSLPRYCFPIRTEDRLLGFMWIIDVPPLTPTEIELIVSYRDRMRDALAANFERRDALFRGSNELTQRLIGQGDESALTDAARAGLLPSFGQAAVWSVALSTHLETAEPLTSAELVDLLDDLHSATRVGSFIGTTTEQRLTFITRFDSGTAGQTSLLEALDHASRRKWVRPIGVGTSTLGTGEDPRDVADQAMFAASVSMWERGGRLLQWADLGAWALLKDRALDADLVQTLSPEAHMLTSHESDTHWRTLLAYLDSGCDAAATCDALHIQRATLYYRLGRVRALVGEHVLADGWARSSAHIALRAWKARTQADR